MESEQNGKPEGSMGPQDMNRQHFKGMLRGKSSTDQAKLKELRALGLKDNEPVTRGEMKAAFETLQGNLNAIARQVYDLTGHVGLITLALRDKNLVVKADLDAALEKAKEEQAKEDVGNAQPPAGSDAGAGA